jgi:hypothetical protein
MADRPDPIADAIARGTETAAALIKHRDEIFPHAHVILLIAGKDGLRACMAGVAEAAIIAMEREARALALPEEGEVLPFPPQIGGAA